MKVYACECMHACERNIRMTMNNFTEVQCRQTSHRATYNVHRIMYLERKDGSRLAHNVSSKTIFTSKDVKFH